MGTEKPVKTIQTSKSSAIGRRAAIAGVVAAGACGVTAMAVPQIKNDIGQGLESLGWKAVSHELDALESVSLDDAIKAAEITKAAVRIIVLPLARLVALIGGDALGVLLASLNTATAVLGGLHIDIAALNGLRDTVASWHSNISSLPIALTSYTTANIDNAETYLKALKKHVQQQG